jgi:tetratricopeptide (TPR) repeat protein
MPSNADIGTGRRLERPCSDRRSTVLRLLGAAALALSIFPRGGSAAQQIHWLRDFSVAKGEAYSQGKLILVFIEANLEDYSYRMNSETWNQQPVVELVKKFICVKVDLQQWKVLSGQYDRLVRGFRIEFVPVTLVVDPVGNQVYRGELFIPSAELVERLRPLPGDLSRVYAVLRPLEKDPENVKLQIAAGDAYHDVEMPLLSNKYYELVADAETVKADSRLAEHIQVNRALNIHTLGELHESIDMFERILDLYPKSENRPMHLATLVKLYLQDLNDGQAQVYLSILRREYPQNRYTHEAEALLKK